jgi:hypothetical protein
MSRSHAAINLTRAFACLCPAALSCGLCLLGLAAASAADVDRVEMRIEMYATAGLHVATNHTIVDEAADRYMITTDVASRGIGSVFIDLTSHSEVRGRLIGNLPRPQAYLGEVHRNGAIDRSRVSYGADGAVTAEATPPS